MLIKDAIESIEVIHEFDVSMHPENIKPVVRIKITLIDGSYIQLSGTEYKFYEAEGSDGQSSDQRSK